MEEQTKKESVEGKKSSEDKKENVRSKLTKNKTSVIAVLVLAVLIAGSYAYKLRSGGALSESAIKEKIEAYVKGNLVKPGTDIKITKVETEGGLYKITLTAGTQEIVSYATKDGKKFFPQALDVDGQAAVAGDSAPKVAEASVKKDVPDVELFVMSYCPYGLQAEKGLLPVIQKLGSKVNFKLEFVDYTLHGKKEFDENLNQYCIQKEEAGKLKDYLNCFTQSGDSGQCLTEAKVSKPKIDACVSATDKSLGLTQKFDSNTSNPPFEVNKDTNDKYGVQGSPTLVINGTVIETGRDSASMLKAVCSAFNNKPDECNATLSSDTPAAGFVAGTTASSADPASCQ
ncbi:MAG: hypothetical protein Q7S18_01910 [bacterium]|nr:hypothetical protein [bacterium]